MDAEVFIQKVNNGERISTTTVVNGVVNLDEINCGPEVSIIVASVTVEKYDSSKHIEISAGNFRVLDKCKIRY